MDILVERLSGLGCGAGLLVSVGSNGGTEGMHVLSGDGPLRLVGVARVGDDGWGLSTPMLFLAGESFLFSVDSKWVDEGHGDGNMRGGCGGRHAISSKIDLRSDGWYMGMNFRRNFLFLSVCLPDPSTLMRY